MKNSVGCVGICITKTRKRGAVHAGIAMSLLVVGDHEAVQGLLNKDGGVPGLLNKDGVPGLLQDDAPAQVGVE